MKKVLLTALFGLILSGCAEVRPFVDARREAGQVEPVGQSRPDRIAVCYNPLWDDDDKVRRLAEDACAGFGGHATFGETRYFNCRLATPNTALYDCRK